MDNVEGFNWDNVLKIKEREEIWDFNEDPEDHSFETQVRFAENMGDGNSNWDYFELENEGGRLLLKTKLLMKSYIQRLLLARRVHL